MAEVDDMVDGKQTENAELIKKLGQSASVKRHDNISQAAVLAQSVVKAMSQVMQYYDDDDNDDDDDDDDDNKGPGAESFGEQAPRRD
jgi:hypothetical protein